MAASEVSPEISQPENADSSKDTGCVADVLTTSPDGCEKLASAEEPAGRESGPPTNGLNINHDSPPPSNDTAPSLGVDDVLSLSTDPADAGSPDLCTGARAPSPVEPAPENGVPAAASLTCPAEGPLDEPPAAGDVTSVLSQPAAVALPAEGGGAAAGSCSRPADVADVPHHVKWVKFHGARTAIITQNVNGPCPLLALINVMLLKGKVQLPPALDVVTIGQLMDYVGDAMLDTLPEQQAQPDFEHNMQDAVAILPKLQTGLDVNVKFCGVQQFEYTSECCIFDLLHVRLYHGWLVDPANTALHRAVGQCGYNQLVDKVITNKSSDDPTLAHDALLAESFLEQTASQLTEHGLARLTEAMQEGELAVFFRNNHFSTIYRYQGQLYLLVTDQGFLREPAVVWETLSSTAGAGQFVDGHFQPLAPESTEATADSQQVDRDFLVALSLQEESTRQQAQELQWEEYRQAEFGTAGDTTSDAELARRLQAEEEERAAREHEQQQQQQQRQQGRRRSSQPESGSQSAPQRTQADAAAGARADSKKRFCTIM